MTNEKINAIILQYKDYISADKVFVLKNYLEKSEDKNYDNLLACKMHNPVLICVLSIFLGGLGIDRMVIGDVGLGVCKLLFGWLTFGIWPFIDIFFCYRKAKEKNFNNLISLL